MYRSITVANYLLALAFNAGDNMTVMKLMKMVYIAHGWKLGIKGEPLIGEQPEAWKFGPVIPTVYHAFKGYGREPIRRLFMSPRVYDDLDKLEMDTIDSGLLKKVYEEYHKLSGMQLSALTHQVGTPWHTVWEENGGKLRRDEPIPNDLIQTYYSKLAKERGRV